MKNLYKRFSLFSFWLCILLLVACPIVGLLTYKGYFSTYETFFVIVIGIVFSFSAYTFFKSSSEKLPELKLRTEQAFFMDEFIFQSDVSFFPRLFLMSNIGEQLFVIEPTSRKPITRLLTFFSLISAGFIIPITYDVMTLDRTRLFSFTVKNEWKQFRVSVKNETEEVIGEYLQPMLKSAVKNKGILYNPQGEVWRMLEAKNMVGDIDIRDEDNRITASYRFGMFPYVMHPAFQAIPNNLHIKLASHITEDERKAYLAIFYFWLARN